MTAPSAPEEIAITILDSSPYMTLATADRDGRPWPTPVYFAESEYADFYWLSSPEARHSRNIAERAEIGIVVFDSTVPVGSAEAVYMEATAAEVADADIEAAAVIAFQPRFPGLSSFTADEVRGSELRLYRATVTSHWILKPRSVRVPGEIDSRIPVRLP